MHYPLGIQKRLKLNFTNANQYNFGGGWGSNGTEIYLPLSPRHMLYTKIGAKPPPRGWVVPTERANWIQRFTVEHAHRYIFSASADDMVYKLRPRTVDPMAFKNESDQWARWHEEQSKAEVGLFK